ncbi:hypothetical protein DMB95_05660 [Campylobacter sp. MIT 12-8780]|nr:hypothetical protein DMB95_05660 [Campylobacter sp. MIT 12-8780]
MSCSKKVKIIFYKKTHIWKILNNLPNIYFCKQKKLMQYFKKIEYNSIYINEVYINEQISKS